MRNLGKLWKKYQADSKGRGIRWTYETRVIVDGDIYKEYEMFDSSKISGLINDEFNIGLCSSTQFNISIIPHANKIIPPNAKVEPQVRIVNIEDHVELYEVNGRRLYDSLGRALFALGGDNTDWVSLGTYYIDYRLKESEELFLECYDAMMFAEQEFLPLHGIIDDYPMPASKMIQLISGIIKVPLDGRNVIRNDVYAQYPNKLTMRDILGFIASAHGGNFYITDDNKLRLVVARNDTPLYKITSGNMKRKTESDNRKFSKLYMVYTDAGDYYEAGTGDTTLEVFNLFATRDITNRVYSEISGYTYNAFDAQSVELDPALELGDSIEVDGEQANLWVANWESRLFCDISAPTKGDTAREFRFPGTQSNVLRRQASNVDRIAELTFGPEGLEVRLGVLSKTVDENTSQINGQSEEFSKFLQTYNEFTASVYSKTELTGPGGLITTSELESRLGLTATEFSTRVFSSTSTVGGATLAEQLSQIKQDASSITLSVDNGASGSKITLKGDSFEVQSEEITFTGMVTFKADGTINPASGKDSVIGSNITQIDGGSIIANSIITESLSVNALQINNVKYKDTPVITCEGAAENPEIQIGQVTETGLIASSLNLYADRIGVGKSDKTILVWLEANEAIYLTSEKGSIWIGQHSTSKIGFYNASPVTRQAVAYAPSSAPTAVTATTTLNNLIYALASLGLIRIP